MKVKADGSLAELSEDRPDATFRILTSLSTDAGHATVVAVEGLDAETVGEFLENDPAVVSFEVLHADERTAVVQYLQESEPAAGRAGRASANPPPYPLVLRDGWIHAESTTTHDRLSQFSAALDEAGVEYELSSVTRSHDPTELLTDRQREFVTEALERGYYDTPRRCSLTDLAEASGVNKATASGILHRAEGTIVEEFMGDRPNAEPGVRNGARWPTNRT